jgi:hypothetical protein
MNHKNRPVSIPDQKAGSGLSSKSASRRLTQRGTLRSKISSQGRFAILLDATGSMSALINEARRDITEIINRISTEANCQVEIEVIIYRDYDVPNHQLIEYSGLQSDPSLLRSWLSKVNVLGGGTNDGEAIEVALARGLQIQNLTAVMLAGDEPANSAEHIRQNGPAGMKSAAQLAADFGKQACPIHAFVVGQRASTVQSFKQIADISGGKAGYLNGSNDMLDMAVMAMLSSLRGRAAVEKYMKERNLSVDAGNYGRLLLGGPE